MGSPRNPSWMALVSMAATLGLVVGIATSPVSAEMTIEEKAKVDMDAKEGLRRASEARDMAARDAVLKEKEAIRATVELKKKAEKEIEEKVATERQASLAARDQAKAEAQAR